MNKASEKIDDQGKKVFVGIDVHKRSYSVVAVVEGIIAKKWRTVASPDKLAEQLRRYFSGASIHTAYEAGFSLFRAAQSPGTSGD